MDPSSPFAMARLVALRDRFDLALGNDADADRHGVVVPGDRADEPQPRAGGRRSRTCSAARATWGSDVAVGKTLVSSSMIDRVVADLGRRLVEVPVGFKWFVDGLVDGSIGFGGEESAGASFLRRDGRVWTTDKDGIIACLLAAELTATAGPQPGASSTPGSPSGSAPRPTAGSTRRRRPSQKARARPARAGGRHGDDARRRPDHRDPHPRARQRRADRRPQGHDRPGLVRGPPVGHRERDQAVRGVASAARRTSSGSSRRRGRSSTRRCQRAGAPRRRRRRGPSAAPGTGRTSRRPAVTDRGRDRACERRTAASAERVDALGSVPSLAWRQSGQVGARRSGARDRRRRAPGSWAWSWRRDLVTGGSSRSRAGGLATPASSVASRAPGHGRPSTPAADARHQ